MKWLASWEEEIDSKKYESEKWLTSWTEVTNLFNEWMNTFSDIVKGEITCYWNDGKIYGDGRPCLIYDITDDNNDEYEDEDFEEDEYYDGE